MPENWKQETRRLGDLKPYEFNPRQISTAAFEQLKKNIKEQGFRNPVNITQDNIILAGHQRLKAMVDLVGEDFEINVSVAPRELDEREIKKIVASDNLSFGEFDFDILANNFDIDDLIDAGFDPALFGTEESADTGVKGSLADKFLVPPFSVLNAREGAWQDRKRLWLSMGIESELGRGGELHSGKTINAKEGERYEGGETAWQNSGTSIFDPVVCELAYTWFSNVGSVVLDPFAGGSVRGIVASKLGRSYIGMELRGVQCAENIRQAEEICGDEDFMPIWHHGDSANIDKIFAGAECDLVFTCPPYADLEVYSDNPADLSTMAYPEFRKSYFSIIKKTCGLLKDNRFAVVVVGEVRGKDGNYYNFVGDTVQAFKEAGLEFYNEAILVTAIGSLPVRAGKQFTASRKLGKTHQNILVFVKGDAKEATKHCGNVEVFLPQPDENEEE